MPNNINDLISTRRKPELASLQNMGLTPEDAEDVFQEASLALFEIISEQRLTIQSSPEAYLHGICNNLAHKRMEALKKEADYIDDDRLDRILELTEDEEEPADEEGDFDYHIILSRVLNELNLRDYSIIHAFYLEGKSMIQVAQDYSLASPEVARTTKSRIINRMRVRAMELTKEYL